MLFEEENGTVIRDYDIEFLERDAIQKIVLEEIRRVCATTIEPFSFTVAFGHDTVDKSKLPFYQASYVEEMGNPYNQAKARELVNLVSNPVVRNKILKFIWNPKMVKSLMDTYNYDVETFRKILPYIELVARDEQSIRELKQKQESYWRGYERYPYSDGEIKLLKTLETDGPQRGDEILGTHFEIQRDINRARANTEISKVLSLEFKKR